LILFEYCNQKEYDYPRAIIADKLVNSHVTSKSKFNNAMSENGPYNKIKFEKKDFNLLSGKDQTLLIRWNSFRV
jgi:hypothetical protein